jgi:hypothetical protein
VNDLKGPEPVVDLGAEVALVDLDYPPPLRIAHRDIDLVLNQMPSGVRWEIRVPRRVPGTEVAGRVSVRTPRSSHHP